MSIQRVSRFLPTAAIASLMTITLFGGCPVAQQPTTPTDGQEQLEPPAAPEPDGDLDRPIPPPDLDGDDQDDSDGGDIAPGGGGGGPGGGGDEGDGGPSSASVTVDEPAGDLAVRPGTLLNVEFAIFDYQGALVSVEFVLVRDDDADYQPDGSPVLDETLSFQAGNNTYSFDTTKALGLLKNGFARLLVGIRYKTVDGQTKFTYASGSLSIDSQAPTGQWVSPAQDLLLSRSTQLDVSLSTTDNRPVTVKVQLDPDKTVGNGGEWTLIPDTVLSAGTNVVLQRTVNLQIFPAGSYYYYVTVSDGIEPAFGFYAQTQGSLRRLGLTDRLIGDFALDQLTDSNKGAILQGFNFNDLAGSAVSSVPDLTGDGRDELVIVSRFGKPYIIETQGVGFGEAYLVYGGAGRLHGAQKLNSVGGGSISGLNFSGIRNPLNTKWTEGISDVTVVPDMDGDELPEIVFSFPRVESINLGETDTTVQHRLLLPEEPGMGNLEYDATVSGSWAPNEAQFTRGGIVVVSSHNQMLTNPGQLSRKFGRTLDLHETGQMFSSMSRPSLELYLRNSVPDPLDPYGCENCIPEDPFGCVCVDDDPDNDPPECESGCGDCPYDDVDGDVPEETGYNRYYMIWDVVFSNQSPGGFSMPWTADLTANPPLANPTPFFYTTDYLDLIYPPTLRCDDIDGDGEPDGCEKENIWHDWSFGCMGVFPCTNGNPCINQSWNTNVDIDGDGVPDAAWTGFYGPEASPRSYPIGNDVIPPTSIGARVLGQKVGDHFGTTVGNDGTWLYISSPKHTALTDDINDDGMPTDRVKSGVVYQLRTDVRENPDSPTRAQLWLEPGTAWPNVDAEITRTDYTMPVPHQYIIENVGSRRGENNPYPNNHDYAGAGDCRPAFASGGQGATASYCPTYPEGDYKPGTAGYHMDRTPQIVGPHPDAEIAFVRGLGDLDGDGIRDFAVGSERIEDPATGQVVGAIYFVFGRSPTLEGDYLLEQLHVAPGDANRLKGLMLKGASTGEKLARVFSNAGDFNGDGYDDVIVGNEGADGDAGEAIVVFGSPTLESPENGWTVDDIVAAGRAVRFVGENPGDLAGANVASAGDVDGDGYADILIAAPGAQAGKGVVYLVYGSRTLGGDVLLANAGSFALPGVRFIGRAAGDALGGGQKTVTGTDPAGGSTLAFSRGVARLGDLDGDGREDYAISAMLADPDARQDAGEVYILYGRGD
ncbi:MAG TPA: hypothetical protein VM487_19465 [Phycisphaerae bacterium]|nr:hypothetical protein [Phycisphaerae bacterium]